MDSREKDWRIVNFYTGSTVNKQSVHWIRNDDISAHFFGTPFAGGGRNQQRGQTINNVNLAVLKNWKVNEHITIETRGTAYNVLNRQYRGVPDVTIDDLNFAAGGSFVDTLFNPT